MTRSCGCCGGVEALTPLETANRPGLDTLSYRVGTHSTFLQTMTARLSGATHPELAALKSRDPSDLSMALLDAWATVADVLTFYQERLANEGYLRTATERRSILEQARLVGYRLRPGVASSVFLAYTIEKDAAPVEIPAGARANSIPAPGEEMQAFETSAPLGARYEWNKLGLRMKQPQTPSSILRNGGLYLKGTSTNLKPNDALLIDFGIEGKDPEPFRVFDVETDDEAKRTLVTLRAWSGGVPALSLVVEMARRFSDFARFDVSPGAMTSRVLATVNEVEVRAATSSAKDMAAYLSGEAFPRLSEELGVAKTSGFARLEPWLAEMISDFSGAHDIIVGSPSNSPEAPKEALSASGGEKSNSSRFRSILDRLGAAPSIPPASSQQLSRSAGRSFEPQADVYPRLLSALSPRIGPSVYSALANEEVSPPSTIKVYALRVKASLFGHNAPAQPLFDDSGKLTDFVDPTLSNMWMRSHDDMTFPIVALDAVYDGIRPDSHVIIDRPALSLQGERLAVAGRSGEGTRVFTLHQVKGSQAITMSGLGVSAKVTQLVVTPPWEVNPEVSPSATVPVRKLPKTTLLLRQTIVYAESELLELADEPISDPICEGTIELDALYDGLESGRWLIVSGERSDIQSTSGVKASELVMLAGVTHSIKQVGATEYGPPPAGELSRIGDKRSLIGDRRHTFITLANKLAYCYKRDTVAIFGNVVHATHGETRNEVLGAGDAAKALQTFSLKQRPLTFTSAPNVSGVDSTLEVRVNDVRWYEATSLADLEPNDRKFITLTDDDAKTLVVFGSGVRGARLPTGAENVKARYRSAIGKPGNVKAEQISLVATRPLGVKGVVNPLRSSGGVDKEGRDQARKNAPLAVMALDRLVSTRDYADFARTFAGIGKASAARLSDGEHQLVHVTIAGADDIPIEVTSDVYRNLVAALHRHGDPHLPIRVEVRELMALVVSANVRIHPDHRWELVEPKIRARLLETFGFDRRELGQGVTPSEVVGTVQRVRGVEYVDLDLLRSIGEEDIVKRIDERAGEPRTAPTGVPKSVVVRLALGVTRPAQLAVLLPGVQDTLILNEVKR